MSMDINPSKDPVLFSSESRVSVVIGVAVALMLGATTAVILRLYTRKIILNQLGLDDWLSIGALFFTLATGVSQCYMTRNGLGRHIGTLPQPDGFKIYMKNFYVVLIWYNIATMLIKMTFLTQYYRVLPTTSVRKLCIVAMVIVGSWSLSQILLTIFLCVPISGFWDSSVEASCIPTPAEWYQNAAGNIVTDVAIFCLPFPVLGRLNLPRAQKYVLLGIFSLGFFTCTISVVRIKFLHLEVDVTWENAEASLWSLCEICSGTICSCLPCLRPLASRWFPVFSTHRSHGYTRQSDSYARNLKPPGDLEAGPLRGTAVTSRPSGSDSDLIFGLEDYKLGTITSAHNIERAPGLSSTNPVKHAATTTASAMAVGAASNVETPWTAQAGPDKTWKQPIIAARIQAGSSNTLVANGNGALPSQHGIQVQHDITVQTSNW
ncbi:hypothetical protein PFICI_14396 [Pestalotiopsis fici W106-1]|uniref:Rhodopsin domain-containing protein n=1 Tax=Pestalotiopsis fici (strain W106-1 / CGMCC3.15140) TaxID=1229662 RepID=W3WKS0_PESFW|nr:uncharacterized protein PFICI_14396 [Pestalotiopsis fici W106-1]ETS74530.1 hypothetical protein PFICI_14396 [Pestalotiopsis fici W106-1]